jgi:hypothetical protein
VTHHFEEIVLCSKRKTVSCARIHLFPIVFSNPSFYLPLVVIQLNIKEVQSQLCVSVSQSSLYSVQGIKWHKLL